MHYSTMTPVQQRVLALIADLVKSPSASEDAAPDLLVKAKTGTGKTIAFLLPVIEAHLRNIAAESEDASRRWSATSGRTRLPTGAVILSPTRELANQIAREAAALTSHLPSVKVHTLVGGESKSAQLNAWRRSKSHDIVVATPGRLLDCLSSDSNVSDQLATARALVLDEADTLLDMGFARDIADITAQLPPTKQRQTFMFSATVSKSIEDIAKRSLKRDNHHFVDTVGEDDSGIHEHIPQRVSVLDRPEQQIAHVLHLLAADQLAHAEAHVESLIAARGDTRAALSPPGKAVIFLPTTKLTELFASLLVPLKRHLPWGAATNVIEIHSGKSQGQRQRAADTFRQSNSSYAVLVTSDVSARGVDYPGVTRVIQVGIPPSKDMYIHRVGRTGRAGKQGQGDLVLQQFERNFTKTILPDLNLEHVSHDAVAAELDQHAAAWDEKVADLAARHEQATRSAKRVKPMRVSSRDSRGSRSATSALLAPVSERLSTIDDSLKTNILPVIADEAVHETFASMLGFYFSRVVDLRTSRESILKSLQDWATGAMGREDAPTVSQSFLQRIGMRRDRDFDKRSRGTHRSFSDDRRSSFGGRDRFGGGDRGDRFGGGDRGDRFGGGDRGDRYGSSSFRDGPRSSSFRDSRPPRDSRAPPRRPWDGRGSQGSRRR